MDFLLNFYDNITSYFNSSDFVRTVFWLKLSSYLVSLVLIFAIAILISRSRATWWIGERVDSFRKSKLPERIEKDWQKIKDRLQKDDEANLKLSVIEADSMLDDVLKRMGLEGKDMGERLEKLNAQQLTSINDVWGAHRLRNLIVHQSDILLTKNQIEKSISAYEKVLKELEVI